MPDRSRPQKNSSYRTLKLKKAKSVDNQLKRIKFNGFYLLDRLILAVTKTKTRKKWFFEKLILIF